MLQSMRIRGLALVAIAAVMLSLTMMGNPVSAQGGHNVGAPGCTQDAQGGRAGGENRGGRQDSRAVLIGVINAALQNTQVGVDALNLSGVNLSVVCLNNVLNANHIQLLSDILNESPILSYNRDVLSNNQILQDFLNNNNIAANVEVISVDLGSRQVFVLRQ